MINQSQTENAFAKFVDNLFFLKSFYFTPQKSFPFLFNQNELTPPYEQIYGELTKRIVKCFAIGFFSPLVLNLMLTKRLRISKSLSRSFALGSGLYYSTQNCSNYLEGRYALYLGLKIEEIKKNNDY